jgi:hypothetical protein
MTVIVNRFGEKSFVFQGPSPQTDLTLDEDLHAVLRGEHGDYAPFREILRKLRRL